MSTEQTPQLYVFFSYAHQDKSLRDKLEDHLSNLKYRGLIKTWHDREIGAGNEWAQQIDIHLNTADIILLLISSNFMASEYCYSIEMQRALERHEKRETSVIPILLRPVLFNYAPFAKLQLLPTNGRPIANWRNRDSAFLDVALGIERVVHTRLNSREVMEIPIVVSPSEATEIPLPIVVSPSEATGSLKDYSPSPPMPAPPRTQSVQRRSVLAGVLIPGGLLILGGLLTSIILLPQHPNAIPFVGAIAIGLILLIGVIVTIRTMVKKREEQRAKREREQREREEQAARRRQREEEQRSFEERQQRVETSYRQQEEERLRERERAYYEKALVAYDQALRLDFSDATAHRGKGNALAGLGRYDEALQALEQAIALTPQSATYVSIGDVLSKLNHYNESLAAYEQAIELDPAYELAYAEMAETLEQLGRTQEAQHVREKVKLLNPEVTPFYKLDDMHCPYCHYEVQAGDYFCLNCGNPLLKPNTRNTW